MVLRRPLSAFTLATLVLVGSVASGTGCRGGRPLEPTLASIQENVFDLHCSRPGCHVAPQPDTRLVLRPGRSHAGLVNISSLQISDRLLVVPFDAEASYLIDKLQGNRIVGEQMPNGLTPLPPATIAVIREWIDRGAPDN